MLIQSEEYLGADGEPADPAKVATGIPDVVTFNGRAFQYDAHPLTARAATGYGSGCWTPARTRRGPSTSSATQFDTVWTEGAYTRAARRGSRRPRLGDAPGPRSLPLLAAQGGFVELVPTEAGHYAIVNHQMSLAEKGAHGVLRSPADSRRPATLRELIVCGRSGRSPHAEGRAPRRCEPLIRTGTTGEAPSPTGSRSPLTTSRRATTSWIGTRPMCSSHR